jgi:hypothetical protein
VRIYDFSETYFIVAIELNSLRQFCREMSYRIVWKVTQTAVRWKCDVKMSHVYTWDSGANILSYYRKALPQTHVIRRKCDVGETRQNDDVGNYNLSQKDDLILVYATATRQPLIARKHR